LSRDLIYRVSIQTNTAKREARNIRSTFEKELRDIRLGNLDTSGIKNATVQVRQLRQEVEQVGSARPAGGKPGGIGGFFSGQLDDALSDLKGLAAGYLSVQGVIGGINEAIDLTRLNTQAERANKSFDILSGGAERASVNVMAIQTAAGGAVTSLDAIAIGNQAASLGLAKTTEGFEDLARSARIITMVSPIIREQGEALTQLALFSSNAASYARADQLGLSATEVRNRIKELRMENGNLDDSQLKLMASMQLLDEKFGALLNTTEAQASGLEKLTTNYQELRIAVAGSTGPIDSAARALASGFSQATTYIAGTDTPLKTLIDNLKQTEQQARAMQGLNPISRDLVTGAIRSIDQLPGGGLIPKNMFGLDAGSLAADADSIKLIVTALELASNAVSAGVPGAEEYFNSISAIAVEVDKQNYATSEQIALVSRLTAGYQESAQAGGEAYAQQTQAAEAAKKAEEARLALIFDQQEALNQALATRAQKAAPSVGIEAAINLYREQKLAAEKAIDELAATGVSDVNEIAIRTAGIVDQLVAPFDALEARAGPIDLTAALGNFDQVGAALSNLNSGFTDFLPGVSAAREELTTLSIEMALTGELSDEQAARLEYLSAVAYSVADGGGQLGAVINDLGSDFLASNAYAAELVNQLVLTEAAYRNGAITGDIYAGVTATLTGKLLTLAQGAGIATGAIYALNDAQADMASPAGLAIGGSIANRIQSQQQTSGREQNRREMERYNRDLARSQERSAGRAGKLLEDGAKRASQELRSALDKVPGLFSASQVTEQDMKDTELGVYQEKADEYLRRLRDEVQNGNDWEDVSLEEARAGLERAGLEVGSTAEQTVALLEKAINDSSLYSAVENIPIFINEEAVKFTQELQSKSEQGRKNIYEYFGIQVDEAVGAATGGGGGGVAVRPPELIDIDPFTDGVQTGLDEYVAASGESVREQIANATRPFFNPDELFLPGTMGAATKPGGAGATDAIAQALAPLVSAVTGIQGAKPQPAITPTVDGAALQAELDKLQITIAPTLAADAGQKIAMALGDQLGQQSAVLISHGAVIGKAFLAGIQQTLSVDDKGNATIDFAGFIANNLGAQAQTFIAQGKGIASLLQQGLSEGMAPAEGEAATGGMAMQISSITLAEGVRPPDVSVMAKIDKFAIDQTALLDADLSIAPTIDLQAVSEEREKAKRALTFLIEPGLTLTEADRAGFISNVEAIRPVVSVQLALPEQQTNAAVDFFAFDGSIPVETVNRADLVTFTNVLPVEQVNRAKLVVFLSELPTEQIDRSALVAFVSEVSKEEIDRSGLVSFLSELPTEQVDRSTLIGYINSPATETIDRAKLVTAINELPIQEVNRQTLVSYLNALPSETVDRSTLVGFVNAIPAENVDRSALVSFANAVPTEHVDRSDLIAFVNALPAENIDRSALVSFLGSVPSEAVDRQTLVSYLNSVPTETIDRANVVAFLGNVTSEQVDRTALVAYIGAVPIFTVDLSKVVEFAGEAVRAAQDKLYSFLYGPSPERPDTAPGITDAGPYAIDIQAQLSPAAYQSYLDYKAEVEANPPTIMPMLQAPGQRLGDVEPLGTIDVTANITKFDVTAQIDETALASLTAPIVYAPQSDAQADFITPLVTGLTTQIGANQDQIGAQGASVAQIIIAGMIAAFQGTQQGGEATTTISDALFFAVNTQFTTAQSSFFTVGSIPAVAVESGFKGYAYDGLSSGLLDALTNGIRADADAYMQRGATIAGYVQKGIGDGFSSDIGIRSAVTAGGVWGNAFVQGALNAINAAGFVDQITTAVVDGITDQVEQP
jgi:cell division protein ZapA (FtsZ GTPase activity inhibitor)